MKPQVLIVHGPIGSGKSRRAEQIANRAKVNGYKVYGVISRRVLRDRETVGYEGYYPDTGQSLDMVYKDSEVSGENWKTLKGAFLYNETAFKIANDSLVKAAHLIDNRTMAVVDEYGHLEARGFGLYPGLHKVVETLSGGGKLLILCRTNKIDNVLKLFNRETKILVLEANRRDFWDSLGDSFI